MMRVVYYTRPWFLDAALPLIRELSRLVELHLMLELSPESWSAGIFDVPPIPLQEGITPADPVLNGCLPDRVREYWSGVASFNLVVHTCRRSLHPRTWLVSRRVAHLVRNLGPDVVHLDDDGTSRIAFAVRDLDSVPMLLGIHDPEPHSGEHNWRGDLARWLSFKSADRFILHNDALRRSFCARYRVPEARVDVIHIGVLSIFAEWGDTDESATEHTVLFFGRLSPYKGLDVLYRAMPLIAARVPGVRFVVAGRPIKGYAPPFVPSLPNGASVELIDRYVSNDEMASFFRRSSVVVCPYTDATQSGVVLAAYAFGKPVVATKVGGLPEYVIDRVSGLLVSPQDEQGLAAAIVELFENVELGARVREGVRRLVEDRLNWRRIAEDTLKSYGAAMMQ